MCMLSWTVLVCMITANINDRSMTGARDTELAALITDKQMVRRTWSCKRLSCLHTVCSVLCCSLLRYMFIGYIKIARTWTPPSVGHSCWTAGVVADMDTHRTVLLNFVPFHCRGAWSMFFSDNSFVHRFPERCMVKMLKLASSGTLWGCHYSGTSNYAKKMIAFCEFPTWQHAVDLQRGRW